ncbi:LOW QUALITY PROTEIN: pericentrin [Electrophorus electricus]|uniref:LOW QUALITY PROTEIN: pericentrin n=1 Tax=Electrophorus electricus TaxID=8005 RepID=UPI0015D08C87|nr:LOW QUALITY PROTEIN: pericentrin [Electrophorus electricus]
MDQDERQRKLEAGRAKLAHFRQQRAKGDSAGVQKKSTKRKGQAVEANALPAQEQHPEQGQNDRSHGHDGEQVSEESQPDGTCDNLAACQKREETDWTCTQEKSSVSGDKAASEHPVETVDLLGEIIVTHTSKEQLKQLQAAVEKRNEIISQLSVNLQAALMSRDKVQLEAQQLTSQIQELQQQLQQAKEYLRSKSAGWLDAQTQQNQWQLHTEDSQQVNKEYLSSEKESKLSALQQKLAVLKDSLSQFQSAFASNSVEQAETRPNHIKCQSGTERSLNSDADLLLQKLRTELDEERQNGRRAHELAECLQKTVASLEAGRAAMEAQLAAARAALERAEEQAHEAQRYKAEKEGLNREVARLDGLVQELQSRLGEEEETAKRLRFKLEAEIANYELRLQTLEEERKMNVVQLAETHEAALRNLRDEHSLEVRHIQELLARAQERNHMLSQRGISEVDGTILNSVKESKELHKQETVDGDLVQTEPGADDSGADVPNDLMERYLMSAVQREGSQVEQSLDEHSLLEVSELSKFEVDSEAMFESRLSDHQDPAADRSGPALLVLPYAVEALSPELGGMSFSQTQWQSFTSSSGELHESVDVTDLGKELLIQQCQDLTEQLEQKERRLEVLEGEVRHSAEELEEARERWSKASEELEEAKWELETEREKRLRCEELIGQQRQEQDNLTNKLRHLESQQEKECMAPEDVDLGERTSCKEELLKELTEEKVWLVLQLKQQEQLVRDIQQQKVAGDSVSSEVQALFGRQLSALQSQRDQLMEQLESQREKNQATAVLLGQKTLEVDAASREVQRLLVEMQERVESLQLLEKVNSDLESKLTCLKQNLTNMEEALSQGTAEKAVLEKRLQTLEQQAENMEKILESELENFEVWLEAKSVDLEQMKEAKEKAEEEHMEKEGTLKRELAEIRRSLDKCVQEMEDVKLALEEKHQKEVKDLSLRLESELAAVRDAAQEEQKKQISLVKQVHEREHQRALSQQASRQREELSRLKAELSDELRESMEAAHQAELSQAQMQHALELDALRLSLTNMHTAQLELSQANLQKEKEAALCELQTSLREKWSQESAMLHTRQQFELERHREQERRAQLQHQQHIDELKREWEKSLSDERTSLQQEHTRKLEDAKSQWVLEAERERSELQSRLAEAQQQLSKTQVALAEAEARLSEARDDLQELRRSEEQIEHLEKELSQAWADRDSAARAVEELVVSHKRVLEEHQARARGLEDEEKRLRQEVDGLIAERDTLKSSSEQEISDLQSQMDSMRTSRQELAELKEQLAARSSQTDDVVRLKLELSQQRSALEQRNEAELEALRAYFEQRLRAVEDGHREEIALLQCRLEESILRTAENSFHSEEKSEEARSDALAQITDQLENHKTELDALRLQLEEKRRQDLEQLRCDMALSYKEELLQARTDLTDGYYSDIEQLNTKHALELEQLRAKLSDSHLKDITKLRLQSLADVAHQVEAQLEERARLQAEEHQARLAQLASEAERILVLENQLAQLTLQHARELERSSELHTEELKDLDARLQKTFDEELISRLEEERSRVTEELSQQHNNEQAQLRKQLRAQAEERLASLRDELQQATREARGEAELKLTQTQELLAGDRLRSQAPQASVDREESPQLAAAKQTLQARYESELRTAKSAMAAEVKELNALLQEQAESRLQDALCRHQEEQGKLEEKLTQQREADLGLQRQQYDQELESQRGLLEQHVSELQRLEKECQELRIRHKAELETLSANSKASLQALEAELSEKHKAELDKLQVVLQETNLAQLEAREAELVARHAQELEELETRLLCNMDTLESTYLREVQAAREESGEALKEQHARELENVREEEQMLREQLQRDMAQVHMDKFSAMATELRQAHQEELSAALSLQKAALDAAHLSALENLQQHVLDLEKQHSTALLEIVDMTTVEKQQQLDSLTAQHLVQLQELRGASAREMEALRRELEEGATRQRLHFQEEAELLKCQVEEQLQQKIAQIKEDGEQERAAAVEEVQRSLREEHQQNEVRYRAKMSQLTAQLQQLDTVVAQLRAEVSGLQGELEGKRAEMATLETLLQRREREGQEGANLLAMLRDDLHAATQQRRDLQSSNDRLQRLLLETLRVTMATEDQISRRLGACVVDHRGDHPPKPRTHCSGQVSLQTGDKDASAMEGGVDCSAFSSATDEGLEVSDRLCESVLVGPEGELDPSREELVLGTCVRLRAAIDKLLELVSDSTQQLEQVHALQAALDERFQEGGEARDALVHHHSQIMEQLEQEASMKNHLQLELHKAEGLMEGYVAEKAALEEALQQKEAREQLLAEELESTRARLQELEEEHVLLQRQRDALSAGLGDTEKALLEEAERLGRERVDVQRQAEKDRGGLAARLRLMELAAEEAEGRAQQQHEQHRTHTDDLQQHIAALEKQLKHHRQFMDEQAVEREHERDEFQLEIKNLEAQLRLPTKGHCTADSKGQRIEDLVLQVESLQALLKDRTEDYGALLAAKEHCKQELRDRDEEIDKLASRVRELEQALLSSAEATRAVLQLEQDLQRTRKSLQDLEQDKESLQQQLYSSKLQMSALQSKLDETRHRVPTTVDPSLRQQLEELQRDLQSREQQVELLLEQVEELQKTLAVREEDTRQITLQMELNSRQSRASEEQLQKQVTQLQETVSSLRRQQEEAQGERSLLQLPVALLEEKNLEIDHLNQQIVHLQQELDTTKDNKIVEETQVEIEELRAEVERLRGDQERLRQAKEEEAEQLHEVIHKLQEELQQLEPDRHEVSDPGADSPESSDFPWSPRPQHGPQESLCHELSSHTLQASRTKLRELQADLERSAEEKEALQRLLLSQEEQYGQQVEALGRSLAEERARLALLEQEVAELRQQLAEKMVEVEELRDHARQLEDGEKAGHAALADSALRLRGAEEGKEEARQELSRLCAEARRDKEERERLEGEAAELRRKSEASWNAVAELGEKVRRGQADVATLETAKRELYADRQALRNREGRLQEEIEKLKKEVTSKTEQIQELNAQLEERATRQEEVHKEVLTCAEETLAKAERALREREEQLVRLRAELDSLRSELAAVKEGLSTSTERADKLQEEGQTKDRALADLEVHNQHLRAELRSLQDDLAVQEEELAYQQRELEELRQRYEHAGPKREPRFLEGLSRDASLSSPEALRQMDCSEERPSHLHASRLSELSALELGAKPSPAERRSRPRRPPAPPPDAEPPSTRSPSLSTRSLSVSENLSVLDSLDTDKMREVENLDMTPSRSPLCSTSPVSVPEWASDGYGSNVSSELEANLKLELEHSERLDAHFVEYLRCRGMHPAPHPDDGAARSLSQELLSPELQAVLKRVYQESCRVLSLSHRPAPPGQPRPQAEEAPPPSWQQERRALQETVLSLRELLCRMAAHEPKANDEVDWRRELLQAVRSVFDSERKWLHAQFQAVMATSAGADHTSLVEHLERLLQKQEQQQRASLEQLLATDHASLLAEVSSLHTQLHACTLQSQEQLREMQGSLHAAQERSEHTQWQLHTRVEEVERRLQQEQTVVHELRHSLEEEQSRGAEQHTQLEAERKVVSEMRAELEESRRQLHLACKGREELQNQILQLRLKLENKDRECQACVEDVEREQTRVKQLQEELHHERLSGQRALEQSTHTQESLRASLSEQASRLCQLGSELEQERVATSNLRSELQMEQSRCEALLAHERERTEQALVHLDAERQRATQLSDALSRQAQEARAQEVASAHDGRFIHDLRAQLEHERNRSEELATTMEELRAQALQGRRRQEEEAHRGQEEARRLREALEGLQMQREEVGRSLEAERRRATQLQVELDEVKGKMKDVMDKERVREEKREKQRRQEIQEQEDKERRQERTTEKLRELEVLRERDQQHVRQLQHTLAGLEQQEKRLASERLRRALPTSDEPRPGGHAHTQESSLIERVLKENSELAERLSCLSEEKVSLTHTVSCLERDLLNFKRSEQTGSSALAEKLSWQKEKVALQTALHRAEADLARVTAGIENRAVPDLSSTKVQRLYEKYLRAESYRKSLAYQKRYLLLLLGGFQDCEQATLALIARMGAQPSLGPAHAPTPLSRFRSAARALIAISRLRFLTRKWQRVTRKSAGGSGAALRTEALKPQHSGAAFNSPPTRDHVITQRGVVSPLVATHDHVLSQRGVISPPVKSPFRLHNGGGPGSVSTLAERTLTPSQDQERSLAEYIQHLENVQQRLGAIRPGSPSVHSYSRKSDR